MSPDRQLVRLMAAMIIAIVAYVAPSAVQAHDGHVRHGSIPVATAVQTGSPQEFGVKLPEAVSVVVAVGSQASALAQAVFGLRGTSSEAVAMAARFDDAAAGTCTSRCCGTMSCCAVGVSAGPGDWAVLIGRNAPIRPNDIPLHEGLGPEASPKPPRTLA